MASLSPAPIEDYPMGNDIEFKRTWLMWFQNLVKFINDNVLRTTVRITSSDSPYTLTAKVKYLKCDTDDGAITVKLDAIGSGNNHKISNDGTSGNDVTLTPNGTDKLYQVNGSEPIHDLENFDISAETTEGWS